MPIDYKKYPPDWHEISHRIRFVRADGKCEWCGAPHGEIIVRDPDKPAKFRIVSGMEIDAAILDDERLTKVVLTTAHLGKTKPDGTPGDKSDLADVRDENLASLCQRCHLNYDLKEHLEKRLASRFNAEKVDGQIFMEDA